MMTQFASPAAQACLGRISDLIEQVRQAAASPQNQGRGLRHPYVTFALEEPMTWVRLWNLDTPRFYSDPLYYVEMVLRQKLWRWDNFPQDTAPITLEIPASQSMYPEYTLLGMELSFSPEGIPTLQTDHPMTRCPDMSLLQPVDFYTSGWMPRILRWWNQVNDIISGRLKVVNAMTWWRGCLDLAMQLRGYEALILDIVERPQFVHDLLKFITEQRCRWWQAYSQHFGLPLQPTDIGEDWLNVPFISPGFFRDFVLPRYLEMEAFHDGIANIHSCGDQTSLQRYFLEIKSLKNYEVSPWTNLDRSLVNLPADKKLMIGIHPNGVLFAPPEKMEAQLREIAEKCAGRNYDIGTSGLTPILENSQAFIHQINTWIQIVHNIFS